MKKNFFYLFIMGIFLQSCNQTAYMFEYILHNTTGHDITIVNSKSNVYGGYRYDSVLVKNNEYYPFYLQSVTGDNIKYEYLLNIESRLYIYSNDTCFYLHPGDSYQNCLWKDSYREGTASEKKILSQDNDWHLNNIYIFDLTDENIFSEVHNP